MKARGAVALLLALVVLTGTAVAALLVSRLVLREQVVEGEAVLGARAALAADSSLAWFMLEGWRTIGGDWNVVAVPAQVFPEEPPLISDGEVRVRFLGPSTRWPGAVMWRLRIQGRVRVMGDGRTLRTFVQTREVYVTVPDERGPPTKRAWRIVR